MGLFLILAAVGLVSAVIGYLFRSPLEEDFGEATTEDIIPADAKWSQIVALEDAATPLARLFATVDGLSESHVEKIALRLSELPPGKIATHRYQIRQVDGESTELHLTLRKLKRKVVEMEFMSSAATIEMVQAAFKEP